MSAYNDLWDLGRQKEEQPRQLEKVSQPTEGKGAWEASQEGPSLVFLKIL